MEKGQSQSKANKGMHRFVSGRSFAVLVVPILLSMLIFNHLKKKKKSAEKESTKGASSPLSFHPMPTEGDNDRYDVFLSFSGSDTVKEFSDQLYHSLVNAGLCVFRDHNSIPIGEQFGSLFLDAITWSKISIPIISENYASSKWCLHELIHIMDRKKSNSHTVFPIFHKVDLSDVRYLKGSFGKAFHSLKKHFDEKDIQKGKQALKEVSNLDGWKYEEFVNGHEKKLIELVVQTVLRELQKHLQRRVPKEPVGLDGQVKMITNWIDSTSISAQMIAIFGMGGIGKTTLAKCIYNQLSSKFMHVSFLQNIQATTKSHGIKYLQCQLISDIVQNRIQVSNVDDGIKIIKNTLKGKKVLIILDDIWDEDDLNALAGERSWFTSGSIIIVTTRNMTILCRPEFKADYIYEMGPMDREHSLILFSKHAFHTDHPPSNFIDFSRDIISTSNRFPWALELIGSYLYGKTNQRIWSDMLKQLKGNMRVIVDNILKLTYDALEDGHKEIFLDIVCFFIDNKSELAIYMWDDCGSHASQRIEELKLRCLVNTGDYGKLRMHAILRDFGSNIICQGQPPKKHSRLWVDEEAFRVLMEKKGTAMVEAICRAEYCDYPFLDDGPADHLQTYINEQFEKLRRLRFLRLRNGTSSGDFDELFYEVRWLRWPGFEPNMSFSATNLHLPKLVVLQLSYSFITEDWKGWNSIMTAKQLKVLQLEYFNSLRCTPDLSAFSELKILILRECRKLEQVHPSIGKVKSLVCLDLSFCYSLEELPREMSELEELKELILDYSGITKIHTSIGSLRKLEKLSARGCRSLGEIPSSIGELQNLEHLDISNSAIKKLPTAIGRLRKLQRLSLKYCLNLKGEVPREIGDLSSLKILEITKAPIFNLPESMQNLSSLQHLNLWDCNNLRSLPKLPSSLKYLRASYRGTWLPELSHLIHLEKLVLSRKQCA